MRQVHSANLAPYLGERLPVSELGRFLAMNALVMLANSPHERRVVYIYIRWQKFTSFEERIQKNQCGRYNIGEALSTQRTE